MILCDVKDGRYLTDKRHEFILKRIGRRMAFLLPPYRKLHIIIFGSIALAAWMGLLLWMTWPTMEKKTDTTVKTTTQLAEDGTTILELGPKTQSASVSAVIPKVSPTPIPIPTINPNLACHTLQMGASAVIQSITQLKDKTTISTFHKLEGSSSFCSFNNSVVKTEGSEAVEATQTADAALTTYKDKDAAQAAYNSIIGQIPSEPVLINKNVSAVYETEGKYIIAVKGAIIYQLYAGSVVPSETARQSTTLLAKICFEGDSISTLDSSK